MVRKFQNRTDHRQRDGFTNGNLEGSGRRLASDVGTGKGGA